MEHFLAKRAGKDQENQRILGAVETTKIDRLVRERVTGKRAANVLHENLPESFSKFRTSRTVVMIMYVALPLTKSFKLVDETQKIICLRLGTLGIFMLIGLLTRVVEGEVGASRKFLKVLIMFQRISAVSSLRKWWREVWLTGVDTFDLMIKL